MSRRSRRANVWYGYVDYTDAGQPFYVGKGTLERFQHRQRNIKHSRVARKYGITRIAEYGSKDESAVLAWETTKTHELGTYESRNTGIGCNLTIGGGGATGAKHSPESVERRAAPRRGVPRKPEVCAKISASLRGFGKGKKLSPESIEKRSAKLRGRHHSPERRRNISIANKGKHFGPRSPEAGAKTSAKLRGVPKSPGHRANLKRATILYNLARRGALHTAEVIYQEELDEAAWWEQERRDQAYMDWCESGDWEYEEVA